MFDYVEVEIYHDEDGNRTCAEDFSNGKVCQFYMTQRFGTYETCAFSPKNSRYSGQLQRRGDDGTGSLIPGDWCPIKVRLKKNENSS